MRILHVITRINQGGTARWLDVLVDEQQRAGHEVLSSKAFEDLDATELGDLVKQARRATPADTEE